MNNTTLYNAAYAAFLSGVEQNRIITSQQFSSYAGAISAATAFATQVDLAIASFGEGGIPQGAELLLFGICISQINDSFPVSIVPTQYNAQAGAIGALFSASVGGLTV